MRHFPDPGDTLTDLLEAETKKCDDCGVSFGIEHDDSIVFEYDSTDTFVVLTCRGCGCSTRITLAIYEPPETDYRRDD